MKNAQKACAKKIIKYGLLFLLTAYLGMCFFMNLNVRDTSFNEGEYILYYIVNADGMKGLGHSILLIKDQNGCGTVLSYNGMQTNLIESLLGKSGVGKMSIGTMNPEETENFLQSGDLHIDGDQLTDNYDMALYRPITAQDYQTILENITPYVSAEAQFTALYEKWAMEDDTNIKAEYKKELEQIRNAENIPTYRIYTNNCDHVARLLASSVDLEMQNYTSHSWRMTPNGNFKAFGKMSSNWGVMELGEQSLAERILMFLMIF